MSTKKLTITAIFASLICVATIFIQIPRPQGYINLGDVVILIGALCLNPISSMFAAGLGSMLADLFLGYIIYSPATLIIKGVMGFSASLLIHKFKKRIPVVLFAYILAETIMALSYTLYEGVFLKLGKSVLITSLPGNIIQGVVSLVISFVLFMILKKHKSFR